MRSIKERIVQMRITGGDLRRNVSPPEVHSFYKWAIAQPSEILQKDIIWLRKAYLRRLD